MTREGSSAGASDVFDYIVVGGGSAGCVVASRLSEDGATVCLLEAGPRDSNPLIHVPAGYIKNIYNPKLTWGFEAEGSAGTAGRRFSLPQGRVLGGSSSINGLNYNRGQAADYNSWAQRGNRGWSYDDVLPYFRRSEAHVGGEDAYRGREGPLPITDLDWKHPICDAFIDGARELGIPRNPDYNGASQFGTGYFQRTIRRGWRVSSARAFLPRGHHRRNLSIRCEAQAMAILLDGRRAVGVRYSRGDSVETVQARREVVISAGTINTPKLLQISGIGPAALLRDIGVPVLHDLPGVGANLRDHYAVRMVMRLKGIRTINNMVQGPPLLLEIARWLIGSPSLLAVSPSLVHVFWKSMAAMDAPDLQFVFTPASFREGVVGLLDRFAGMTTGVWQQRPESLGYVHARSANPAERPTVQPNYLAAETDRQVLLAGMRLGRQLMNTSPLRPFLDHMVSPDERLVTDDELLDFARHMGTTVYHLIGTARMGPMTDPTAVVDDQLRVHGLERLRVADASIMPSMPSANTNAATVMIGEKAADLIKGRTPQA